MKSHRQKTGMGDVKSIPQIDQLIIHFKEFDELRKLSGSAKKAKLQKKEIGDIADARVTCWTP